MEIALIKNGRLFREDTGMSFLWAKRRWLPLMNLAIWNNGLFKIEVRTLGCFLPVGGVDVDLTGT